MQCFTMYIIFYFIYIYIGNKKETKKKGVQNNNNINNASNSKANDHEFDTSGFASETTEQEVRF